MNRRCLKVSLPKMPERTFAPNMHILELGINLSHIRMKTLSVLNPFSSVSADVIGDCDLAGPLMFCMALGSFLLLVGRLFKYSFLLIFLCVVWQDTLWLHIWHWYMWMFSNLRDP